jgi:hypothetical protein
MTPYPEVPQQYLRLLQTMHLGIGFSIVPLSILIPVIAGTTSPTEGEVNMINLLTQFHVFVFVASIIANGFITPRLTRASKEQLQTANKEDKDAAWTQWLESYRTSLIVTLALREGPALLGLVTLILASINGVLWENSFYWVNYFSTALFALYLVLSFPTEEKVAVAAQI